MPPLMLPPPVRLDNILHSLFPELLNPPSMPGIESYHDEDNKPWQSFCSRGGFHCFCGSPPSKPHPT
ncbi:hypothetical protein VCHA34P112_70011 [Vibrio chagasii]|nr:hypothetical protein VCHA34P112_70011 [Vibrio chagasii]CAH7282454.1 hypothetical protein VCHA40O235_50011 [Vibrio chagasii]CAH7393995.1 hypothetical protein VCHA56P515_70010 [Vibrio chagasii]CAH7436760.1 hypothetical protein VCHA53O463_70010 [Vibrio chagasii]